MMNGWGDGVYGWVGPVLALIFLVLIALGIVLLVRGTRGAGRGAAPGPAPRVEPAPEAPPRSPALDVLEDRYARGEIDREEFLQRKKDLSG
ncbi:MAG: SHOCT domain-containing protein [Thermoleophilia bacterium]|nr:SHOCT domain-containing protein [Thermoleophilia bacterium]